MIVQKSIEVVLPLPIDKTFSYAVTKEEFNNIIGGSRVVVSFGKKKFYSAVVIDKFSEKNYDYELKEIEYIIDDKPCVNDYQIKFFKWIADYYMCPLGKVFETALPKLFLIKSETIIEILSQEVGEDLSEKAKNLFYHLSGFDEISLNDIIKLCGKDSIKLINELAINELIQLREEIYNKYKPKTETFFHLNSEITQEKISDLKIRSKNHLKVINYFFGKDLNYRESKRKLTQNLEVSFAVLNTLVKKNILFKDKVAVDRFNLSNNDQNTTINLTLDQKKAYSKINDEISRKRVVLFKGVTSSGKTEVYIELIKEVIQKKLNVLFLVPEIALTTQLVSRLKRYFPKNLHVYHSGINPNIRYEIWSDLIDSKTPKVVLGARSSIFLPFKNLGLVVVDEENETSYKQFESSPLYNARDLAVYLSKLYSAGCILASATPSIESFHNSVNKKYSYVELNKRFGDFELPELIFIENKNHDSSVLPQKMLDEIEKTLSKNQQIIIFRNRRGYSTFMQCSACLNVDQCPNCDVSLTLHLNQKILKCHYCGFSKNESKICNSCGLQTLERKGMGTQLVEDEIQKLFPNYKIGRLDFDNTRKKTSFKDIITAFENNDYQILVGTQMVTKGLDFSNVSLVCVIESDFLLNYPDFRSHERYFQLIKQVAGRAGRSSSRGKVLIQTKNSNHYVNRRIFENDDLNFYNNQIDQRLEFNYPPFSRLIKISIKSKKNDKLYESSKWLASSLIKNSSMEVLGPEYPLVSRINNFFIVNILLKIGLDSNLLQQKILLKKILKKFNNYPEFRSVKVVIDVDPYN